MRHPLSPLAVLSAISLSSFTLVGLTILIVLTYAPTIVADEAVTSVFPMPQSAAAVALQPISHNQDAFWKKRPELVRKIRDERSILVSVTESNELGKGISFKMLGVGIVRRSKEFSFRASQEYSRLPQVSDHFQEAVYAESSHQLLLVVAALGFKTRMVLRILPVAGEERSELQWEVIHGSFKGLKGLVGYERDGDGKTEMSLDAHYTAETLPLPKPLMGFALEVIIQKVAEKMRSFIESESPQK